MANFFLNNKNKHPRAPENTAIAKAKKPLLYVGGGAILSNCSYEIREFAKKANIPVMICLRGNDIDRDFFDPAKHAQLRWTIENADSIACVSTEMQRKIQAWFQRSSHFIPNSVNPSEFFPILQRENLFCDRYNIPTDKPILGLFGEFKEKRGLELLSKIALELEHWTVLIVGHVRPSIAYQIPPSAMLIPVLSDISELREAYSSCTVLLQPSHHDGMPNVVLEALACGVRVLASRAGGLSDCSGVLFCGEASEWIEALQRIRRKEMPRIAVEFHSPHDEAQRYLELFRQLSSTCL